MPDLVLLSKFMISFLSVGFIEKQVGVRDVTPLAFQTLLDRTSIPSEHIADRIDEPTFGFGFVR